MAEGNDADWRELCAAVVREVDPAKVDKLVKQIIEALDRISVRQDPPVLSSSPVSHNRRKATA